MNPSREDRAKRLLSGQARGIGAALARGGLACAEPLYSAAVRMRNRMFDANLRTAHPLHRPTLSVGNLTTGGVGKTPMVRWLAGKLLDRGIRPAILLRGYRSTGGISDEATMLAAALPGAVVHADPDRVAAARLVLQETPDVGCFILDDGFQHRRAARDLDIVLVHATEPFGYGHVLPRGLLREPIDGLRRADVIVITHADEIPSAARISLVAELSRRSPVPILACEHRIVDLVDDRAIAHPPAILAGTAVFAFCGIGSPGSFFAAIERLAGRPLAGSIALPDHHRYSVADLAQIRSQSAARMIVTTEKDAVKIPPHAAEGIHVARIAISFHADGAAQLEHRLLAAIR